MEVWIILVLLYQISNLSIDPKAKENFPLSYKTKKLFSANFYDIYFLNTYQDMFSRNHRYMVTEQRRLRL